MTELYSAKMEKKQVASKLNVILGFINLAAFLFAAGMTWSRVGTLETNQREIQNRVERMENLGTISFQKYSVQVDERDTATKARLTAVELATAALPIIQGDLRVISGKLDGLREELQRHETMTIQK